MSNTENIIIESASANDFREIMQLYRQLWETWELYDEVKLQKIFEQDLNSCRKLYFVARKAGRIVGVCSLLFKNDLHYLKTAIIDELVVDASHRKQGIGKKLMDEACQTARGQHCYRVELSSNMARIAAHRFYENYGFEKSSYYFKKKL